MNWLQAVIKRHENVLRYLFFGALTTAVNYLVYLPLLNSCGFSGAASNAIAWSVAVLFAFMTNKPFVFQSKSWKLRTVIPEFGKFLGCRIGSGLVETGLIFLLVDLCRMDGNLIKLVTSILVVILNYFGSKLFVFYEK